MRNMSTCLANQSKYHLYAIANPETFSFFFIRHFSSKPNSPQGYQLLITQVVQLFQPPHSDWNLDELRNLLFSDSNSPISSRLLFQVTRRLDSSFKALKFFDYIHANGPTSQNLPLLSSTLQAVLELASREPSSHIKLLELYKRSKEKNVPLTVNAATLLIRCFFREGMVDESLLVYNELAPSSRNSHIRNVLIDKLLKSRRYNIALQMLDEMLEPNSEFPPNDVTIYVVFSELLNRRQLRSEVNLEEIAGLVFKFGRHGVFLDTVNLTNLIVKLCWNRKTDCGWDVLFEVMKLGGKVEVASCNALLTGLGRIRNVARMNELMEKMKEWNIQPNVVTFGIIINHLCKNWKVDEALQVFGKMKGGGRSDEFSVAPDVITYNTLIDGLSKVGRQEEGLSLMEQMRSQEGCAPNIVTYNSLIDGFNKAGEIEKAFELFVEMKEQGVAPNVITLNTMVDGMCKHGMVGNAVEFFNEMQNNGLKGNVVTYTSLITAFCNVNNINKAKELFDQMLKNGCNPDAIVYYSLISGLSQAGRMDDASDVTSRLKEAGFSLDIVSYNIIINGFCKKNNLQKAYEVYKEMKEVGAKPDNITYNTLISFFCKTGKLKSALSMMKRMKEDGVKPNVITFGALIHAYCLNGNTKEAMKIFRDMSIASKIPPNIVIYNILIDTLCMINEVEEALSLMEEMKENGVMANTITYNALFKGLKGKNLYEKALHYMDQMVAQACHPDYVTLEILTEWLPAVGKREKLRKFIGVYEVLTLRPKKKIEVSTSIGYHG